MTNLTEPVPLRYVTATYEDFSKELIGKIKLCLEERKSFFICGNPGVGKTRLAYAIVNETVIPGGGIIPPLPGVRYINLFSLLNKLRNSQTAENSQEVRLDFEDLYKYNRHHLIVDDIGAEKVTDWVRSIFFELVDYRYNHLLPTIFISNLTLQDLEPIFGERIVSRIVGMSEKNILFEGDDKRLNHD